MDALEEYVPAGFYEGRLDIGQNKAFFLKIVCAYYFMLEQAFCKGVNKNGPASEKLVR